MRKIFIIFMISIVIFSCQNNKPIDTKEETNSFLWKLQKNSTVYLLGSIHVGKEHLYPLNDAINNAFDESDFYVMEVNFNKINLFDLSRKMLSRGMYPEGQSLKDRLSEEDYNYIKQKLEDLGYSIDTYQYQKPWLIGMYVQLRALKRMGYNEEFGIDMHFLKRTNIENSKETGKKREVIGLETADFQLDLLSSYDEDIQVKFLKYQLNDIDKMAESMDSMLVLWKQGKTEAFDSLMKPKDSEQEKVYDVVYEKLLYERNINMAKKISEFLQNEKGKTYFVVVGAAHLVGEGGILDLLKKEGYAYKQL